MKTYCRFYKKKTKTNNLHSKKLNRSGSTRLDTGPT